LHWLIQQGQKIYRIDKNNVQSILPLLTIGSDVKNEIINAVATGDIASIHENNISVGRWSGVGYILTDPITGSAAYKISGGYNGSSTNVASLIPTPILTFWETWEIASLGNKTSSLSRSLGIAGVVIGAIAFAMETFEKCKNSLRAWAIVISMILFLGSIGAVVTASGVNPLGMILMGQVLSFAAERFMQGVRHLACQD